MWWTKSKKMTGQVTEESDKCEHMSLTYSLGRINVLTEGDNKVGKRLRTQQKYDKRGQRGSRGQVPSRENSRVAHLQKNRFRRGDEKGGSWRATCCRPWCVWSSREGLRRWGVTEQELGLLRAGLRGERPDALWRGQGVFTPNPPERQKDEGEMSSLTRKLSI